MPMLGFHFMYSAGLFFAGGCTALFGTLALMPYDPAMPVDWTYLLFGFVIRVMYAIGAATFNISTMASIPVIFPGEITAVMGYSETAIGLGVMLGPALGSGLFKIGGFLAIFTTLGGVIVLCAAVVYFILPDIPRRDSSEADVADDQTLCGILSNLKIVVALLLTIFSGVIATLMDPILEPELRNKYGFAEEISSLTFLLLSGVYIITTPVIGKILNNSRFCDAFVVMGCGLGVGMVSFLLAGPSPLIPGLSRPLWLLLINVGLTGFTLSLVILPTMDIVFNTKDDLEHSSSTNSLLAGLWNSAFAIGAFFGPTISGAVVQQQSFGWAMTYYSISSGALMIAVLVFIIYSKCRREGNTTREDPERKRLLSENLY